MSTLSKNRSQKKVNFSEMSQMGMVWYRFRRNRLAVIGMSVMALLILICFSSPLWIDYENQVILQNLAERFTPPCKEHWFGTDMYGRDLFARIIYGGMISLSFGFAVEMITIALAVLFGGIAGYFGGKIDTVIMRFIDIFMAIPFILMVMILVLAMGQNTVSLLLALAISYFPSTTRIVRSSIMTIRDLEYVEAARCYGSSFWEILFKQVLPNGLGPVIVTATLNMGAIILAMAGLGFVGLGIPAPTPEWGTILCEARDYIRYYPYLGIVPGVFIGLAVMSLNFMGDGLRDAFDPNMMK